MNTVFNSNQYGISNENLLTFYSDRLGADRCTLEDVKISPIGRGHYDLTSTWTIDGVTMDILRITTDAELIDAWHNGAGEEYIDEEEWYDTWYEVVEALLKTINLEKTLGTWM